MLVGIGVAVAFLYSGTGQNDRERKVKVADSDRCLTLCAVPSDAILVSTYNKASKSYADGVPMVESLHYYSGSLYRLNVLDFGKAHEAREVAKEKAVSEGLYAASEDNLLLVSDSETLLKSSQRHVAKGISVLDAAGFQNALATVDGKNNLYIPNCHFGKLLPSLMPRPYSSYAGFLERLSQWCMFNLNSSKDVTSLTGTLVHDSDASDFMNVFEAMKPAPSEFSTMLPSYTLFANSGSQRFARPIIHASAMSFAIISFALNRYYTEFYRSKGYNFDITSSTQYDQKFINGRNIYENIMETKRFHSI